MQPCFILLCNNQTEKECLGRGLFADRANQLAYLSTIRESHVGFLLNFEADELLGVFVARGTAGTYETDAFSGGFPAQVRVRPLGDLQRLKRASERLSPITGIRQMAGKPYRVPPHKTYGPDVTERILNHFQCPQKLDSTQADQQPQLALRSDSTLDDVAGLDDVKRFVHDRIIAPFEDEEAAASLGLRVGGGMLLFGPPGTGKTLLAESIAASIQSKFLEISPSVIAGYPGTAEKRIETMFSALENEPRAVVFLDEAEWILNKRLDQGSSVMQRITPVLLAQLTRLFKQRSKPIVVIAATNKPEMIDPAFLRPGRFDKMFFVDLPDRAARIVMLQRQLASRANNLTPDQIEEIATRVDRYSGADIQNIIDEAALLVFQRRTTGRLQISLLDLEAVIGRIPPSVSLEEHDRLRKWAENRSARATES